MGWQHAIAGGQGNLIVTSLKSPNFVTGVSGWTINKNGSAEFNDVTIRGNLVVDNNGGIFVYAGLPGPGNPPIDWISSANQDPFGNPLPGNVIATRNVNLLAALNGGGLDLFQIGQFTRGQVIVGNPGSVRFNSGQNISSDGIGSMALESTSPAVTDNGATPQLILYSPTALTLQGTREWYPPSGDPSGVTDRTAINNALLRGLAVDLLPGTYWIDATIEYPGGAVIKGASPQQTIIKVVSGSGLSAALASKGWLASSNGASQPPVYMSGFRVDANASATHGIVSQNFWSYFTDLEATNANTDGLRFDAFGANGSTEISGTAVENHVTNCQFRTNTGSAFRTHDNITNQHFTDGWLTDCVVQAAGATGTAAPVQVDAMAGWKITGNHVYGAPTHGINGSRSFNTRITENYIESWGLSTTASGYNAISIGVIADNGAGSVINDNVILQGQAPGNAATTLQGITVQASNGATGNVTIDGNSIGNSLAVNANWKAAIALNAQGATATLNAVTAGNFQGAGWTAGVVITTNGGVVNHTAGI